MDTNQSLSGWKKDGMIPGFIEGLEKLSFGDKAILFIPSLSLRCWWCGRCNSSNTFSK
jgi:hypothetical protein